MGYPGGGLSRLLPHRVHVRLVNLWPISSYLNIPCLKLQRPMYCDVVVTSASFSLSNHVGGVDLSDSGTPKSTIGA